MLNRNFKIFNEPDGVNRIDSAVASSIDVLVYPIKDN